MVAETVDDPLEQRVLDPSCGSGTFLFHSVRHYLRAAEEAGLDNAAALVGVTRRVLGIDVHPVAIVLARLTYLLAIGRERLRAGGRPDLQIPVWLGDSVQWRAPEEGFWTKQGLTIAIDDGLQLWSAGLHFPSRLLDDAQRFDQLVEELARRAATRDPGSPAPSLVSLFSRYAVHPDDQAAVEETFTTMCRLQDEGRDHVWSFYIRNLARPSWLSHPENRVDVILGNPPWLAYRFMTLEMQEAFRRMSEDRGLWAGATVATHQDLSGLFLVRAAEQYLRPGGRFSLVMPLAALSRRQFAGLRTGHYRAAHETRIAFGTPWDLHRVKPNLFRVPPSVVSGTLAEEPNAMRTEAEDWSGRLPSRNVSWEVAEPFITRKESGVSVALDAPLSPYHSRFMQGATLVPRFLLMVEDAPAPPLGVAAGRRAVRSMRTANEKPPWKNLPGLEGSIEEHFVRPVYLGSSLLPFRLLEPWLGIVPWDGERLMEGGGPWPRVLSRAWRVVDTGGGRLGRAQGRQQPDSAGADRLPQEASSPVPHPSAPRPLQRQRAVPHCGVLRQRPSSDRAQALLGRSRLARGGLLPDGHPQQSRFDHPPGSPAVTRGTQPSRLRQARLDPADSAVQPG
jgi:hypothetical protein